jgi:cation diffusion facilitator family transporter
MAGAGHGTRAVVVALGANLGIATAKFVGFLLTGSGAMLAESVHSVADSGNQGLLLFADRSSRRAATTEHPFGYGRVRYFWAFVVALVLFSLGGGFAVYEGIEKLRHPHELESVGVAVGILLLAVVLEGFAFRTAVLEARKVKGDASWWSFIRRAKAPELPVILLEDLGALVGLVIALTALGLSSATGDAMWDGIGTVSIGVLLSTIAIVLAIEMRSLLIGESATPVMEHSILTTMEGDAAVVRVLHMRTQHLGPDELLVGAKLQFDPALSIEHLAGAVNRVESAVRAAVPEARLIYLEPDLLRVER